VGPGPLRLAEIEFLRDKSSGATSPALVRVVLVFSEPPAAGSTLPIEVKQLVGSTWTALALTQQTTREPGHRSRPEAAGHGGWGCRRCLDRNRWLWSGGGGVQYYVPPSLSISLPSGAKKP